MRLDVSDGPGGLRHLLSGRQVVIGAELEVWIPRPLPGGGLWVRGRYEWTRSAEHSPMVFADGICVILAPDAVVRWPVALERAA